MQLFITVIGDSVNLPLIEDQDTLLISELDSPANFDLFPVYFEKQSKASATAQVPQSEIISTSETVQSRFSSSSRPNPKPFNLNFSTNDDRDNPTKHLKLEDFFGTPQPPTVQNALQASQLDQLSNIKIKHRSDTSPSAFKTHNKKKIRKKHFANKKYNQHGHRGSQHGKYPKKTKKPVKIRILSKTQGNSRPEERENHHNKRKVPLGHDLRNLPTENSLEINEGKPDLIEILQRTGSVGIIEASGGETKLEESRRDFLGKLRSMTGGQVVAVTVDKVHKKKSQPEEEKFVDKLRKEIEKNLKKKSEIVDKKNNEGNVPQFEGFPVVEQKTLKPRRQERQLKEFRIPEKPRPLTSKNLVDVNRPRTEKGRRGGHTSVGTVKRYRFENADGSITWGYTNQDGSFKEETIGTDCVTQGRYGYVDPTGEAREYSYTSGIRCDPTTREIEKAAGGDGRENVKGYFDYASRKFIMPDGRRVTVRVNPNKRARGKRF